MSTTEKTVTTEVKSNTDQERRNAVEKLQEQASKIKSTPAVVVGVGNPNRMDASKFVYIEKLLKALDLSLLTEENIILFGKGGHGKSEVTEHFFNSREITPYVKTMGSGTTTDTLFGGIDIKSFNETGKIEYLVENSFMNHEYVVFEELFDAPDYILEQLKDILTSKQFRNGTQVFNIKTKLIVCCTNKTREEFSKNDSLRALMERFPLEHKVEWDSYTRTTYSYMFKKLFGDPFDDLSYLLEKLAQAGTIVSPRTAVKAAKIVMKSDGDMSCLSFIADFSGKNANLVAAELAKFQNVKAVEELVSQIEKFIATADDLTLDSLANIAKIRKCATDMSALVKQLKSKKVDDELLRTVQAVTKNYEDFITRKTKEINDASVKK